MFVLCAQAKKKAQLAALHKPNTLLEVKEEVTDRQSAAASIAPVAALAAVVAVVVAARSRRSQ